MSDTTIISLLIVDNSLSDIDFIAQTLRSAGYVVESYNSDQETEVNDIIKYKSVDLVMVRQADQLPSIETVRSQITSAEKDIPLIVILDAQSPNLADALKAGADNAFYLADSEHLKITVDKEYQHLKIRHQLDSYQTRLDETENRSRALMDNSRDAIAYIHEGAHIYANPGYLQLFGYAHEADLEGVTLMDLVARKDQDKLKRALRNSMKKGKGGEPIELTGLNNSGDEFSMTMECIPTRVNDEPCQQILIHRPSTTQPAAADPALLQAFEQKNTELEQKLKAYEKQLVEFSRQDELTRFYNRKHFTDHLDDICSASSKKSGCVFYILLTDYRSISESLGLEGIDLLLADLAKVIRSLVSKKDVVAHFSDAVFTIYTPKDDKEAALKLGEQLSHAIKDHASSGPRRLITTGSAIGICQVKEYHTSATHILTHADRACEEARQKGPNQVSLYSPDTRGSGKGGEEAKIELILDAFTSKRISMLYQPIASFQSGDKQRYKASIRMLDSEKKTLPLSELVPIAEQHGLMSRIDKWLLTNGLNALKQRAQSSNAPTLFIRISGNSLTDSTFFAWLEPLIQEAGIPNNTLVFEITEDTAERYFREAQTFREQAIAGGYGIALSHFGGKENSERILKNLAPDYIKLDVNLIEKLSKDPESRQAMINLTELSKEMETLVVATDIASAPQMANIWQYGVTLVEGDMVQEANSEMNFDFKEFAG